jgi:hypothetical protein
LVKEVTFFTIIVLIVIAKIPDRYYNPTGSKYKKDVTTKEVTILYKRLAEN